MYEETQSKLPSELEYLEGKMADLALDIRGAHSIEALRESLQDAQDLVAHICYVADSDEQVALSDYVDLCALPQFCKEEYVSPHWHAFSLSKDSILLGDGPEGAEWYLVTRKGEARP